jgi:DNA uptake protein ComE-like DNA-binding protein
VSSHLESSRDLASRHEARSDASASDAYEGSSGAESVVFPATCIAIVAACGLLAASVKEGGAEDAVMSVARRLEVPIHRIDINRAGVAELALLPEIGPGLAERIAADRALHGAFASIDDLVRVGGIGPARLEALRPAAIASDVAVRDARAVGAVR